MSGIVLTAALLGGAKTGVVDSSASLQNTFNNAYLGEIALMLIGFAFAVGLISFLIMKHKGRTGGYESAAIAQNNYDWNMLNDRSFYNKNKK